MATATPKARQVPAVLHDLDWGTYTRLLRAFQHRRGFRLTYDRGILEIMSPLWEHGAAAYILGRFVDVLTQELMLPCRAGGMITLRRKRKQRGLEPENCYWIASAGQLHGKTQLDLRIDPPPDLAIEVDVTHGSIDRLAIYAALGVPEVWRLSNQQLSFHVLDVATYQVRPNSLSFPRLASTDLLPFFLQWGQIDDTALVVRFRDWVQQVLMKRG